MTVLIEKNMPPYSIEWKCWKKFFNTKLLKAIIPFCLVISSSSDVEGNKAKDSVSGLECCTQSHPIP